MSKYYVGQRIEVVVNHPDDNEELIIGDRGTIKRVMSNLTYAVSVEFDRPISGGWDCNGYCKHGYGWNLEEGQFIIIVEEEDDSEIELDDMCFENFINDFSIRGRVS